MTNLEVLVALKKNQHLLKQARESTEKSNADGAGKIDNRSATFVQKKVRLVLT